MRGAERLENGYLPGGQRKQFFFAVHLDGAQCHVLMYRQTLGGTGVHWLGGGGGRPQDPAASAPGRQSLIQPDHLIHPGVVSVRSAAARSVHGETPRWVDGRLLTDAGHYLCSLRWTVCSPSLRWLAVVSLVRWPVVCAPNLLESSRKAALLPLPMSAVTAAATPREQQIPFRSQPANPAKFHYQNTSGPSVLLDKSDCLVRQSNAGPSSAVRWPGGNLSKRRVWSGHWTA